MNLSKTVITSVGANFLLLLGLTSCWADRSIGFKGAMMNEVRLWLIESVSSRDSDLRYKDFTRESVAWNLTGLKKAAESVAGKYKNKHRVEVMLLTPPEKICWSNFCRIIVVAVGASDMRKEDWVYGVIDFNLTTGELIGISAGDGAVYTNKPYL